MATGRLYSLGYEGWSVEGLVENLAQNRVELLVDVRLNAVSRRPGFSKRKLAGALAAVGIEYVHEPALGNPAENRSNFSSSETLERGRRAFRKRLDNGSREAFERLVTEARARRVAVMCVERAEHACHRWVITEAAQELDPQLEIFQVL